MESVSFDEELPFDGGQPSAEKQPLGEEQPFDEEQLRERVRATRRATSAPLLIFGVAMLVFAAYQATVHFAFVPLPLYWPLCSLLALVALAGIDRVRRERTGVGSGRLSYAKAAVILAAVVVAGNVAWFFPFAKLLLLPTTVLTVLALWQSNRPLAARAGIVAAAMIAGLFAAVLVVGADWFGALVMGAGGAALTVMGLVARARERVIE